MRNLIVVLFLLASKEALAGFSAIVIAYGTGNVPVNSSIDLEAEYVAMSVTLSSDEKYPSQRAKALSQLQEKISEAASKSQDIEFQKGVISLSPREKSSFSFSKPYVRSSGFDFYLLSRLSESRDVFAATQKIYSFINSIRLPDEISVIIGNTTLAIDDPDKYRNQLLEKVKEEIVGTKNILGSKYKASVTGLESPVIVRQKNDRQVTLFIEYRFELAE